MPTQIADGKGNVIGQEQLEEQFLVYQQQLRSLASDLVVEEERSRRHIAIDLYDGIGQELVAVSLKLAALQQDASPKLVAELDSLGTRVNSVIKDARSLTMALSPPVIYELGLEAGVRWLADRMREKHGFSISVTDDELAKPLAEDVRIVLFRAVQELLDNARKHSKQDRARVHLFGGEGQMTIIVEDDGVGFDASTLELYGEKTSGFGLFNLRERIAFFNGTVSILTELNKGTRITIRVPLKQVGA